MTGIKLFDGDIVVFATGFISSEGVYALTVNGDVLVKRIEFGCTTILLFKQIFSD